MSNATFDSLFPLDPSSLPILFATGGALCTSPHCNNLVEEPWEETGTLCATCAVEADLADRLTRWDRLESGS